MQDHTQEKLLQFLSMIAPDNMQELIGDIINDKVSPEQFRTNCMLQSMVPEERKDYLRKQSLAEKFKDYQIFSNDEFCAMMTEKFPDGIRFKVDGFGIEQLYNLIRYENSCDCQEIFTTIGDMSPSVDGLQADFLLSASEYKRLLSVHSNTDECEELEEYLEANNYKWHEYSAAAIEGMHYHPDGNGIQMFFQEDDLYDLLRICGQPLDKVKAILLQQPGISESFLKDLLEKPQVLDSFLKRVGQEQAAEGCRIQFAGRTMAYFYEPGKLGYMTVDHYRKTQNYGEPLNPENQQKILDLAKNGHIIKDSKYGLEDIFFGAPEKKDKEVVLMHKQNGKCDYATEMKNYDGTTFYKIGKHYIDKTQADGVVDITGRISDVVLLDKGSPSIRCKIDGEQQMARFLKYEHRTGLYYSSTTPEEKQKKLFEAAVSLFKDELLQQGQERQKSYGR